MCARPNVLFILTDDQGYGDLSCHGNPVVRTPAIDALHDDSVRLHDFHVGPTCAPTRATLMTGHYANSTGVWHTVGGRSLLRENEWTIATALRDAGYRTALFGKWHLGDNYPYRPMDRGFEHTVTHGGGGITQTPDHWGNDYFDDVYDVDGEPTRFEGYCTDVWFRLTQQFIDAPDDRPFFCMLTTNAPHGPFNVEPAYREPYEGRCPDDRAAFFGMIQNIDENIAQLRAFLTDRGLAENTILMFMTDNGTSRGVTLDENGFVTEGFNASMRGKKGSHYEGGHRTPCFFHWPMGGLTGGRDVTELTASVDIMPTLLDLCGVNVPAERSFHGTSIAPVLRNGTQRELDERVVVTDSQRIPMPEKWRRSCAMRGRWRMIDGVALYDVSADPEQRHDIASEHPEIVRDLYAGYEDWWQKVSTQFDTPIPIAVRRDAPVDLTAHDWRNENADCPWNQGQIRQGKVSNGYWELDVRAAGRYRIELRRWPVEAAAPIDAAPPANEWRDDAIASHDAWWYEGGAALPIESAELHVADQTRCAMVQTGQEAVVFEVDLPAGYAELRTALIERDTGVRRGAYYVRLTAV